MKDRLLNNKRPEYVLVCKENIYHKICGDEQHYYKSSSQNSLK